MILSFVWIHKETGPISMKRAVYSTLWLYSYWKFWDRNEYIIWELNNVRAHSVQSRSRSPLYAIYFEQQKQLRIIDLCNRRVDFHKVRNKLQASLLTNITLNRCGVYHDFNVSPVGKTQFTQTRSTCINKLVSNFESNWLKAVVWN